VFVLRDNGDADDICFARVLIGAWHDRVAAVEDFAELTEEDVASITSGMTRVEAARFQAAVTRLQTAPNAGGAAQDDSEVRAPSHLPWYHCTVASA
jgi:hypothetical protein